LTTDQVGLLRESWDAHAHEWIKWVRAPGRQDSYWRFHRERFLSLVPDAGQLTVDIGCGEGRVGRDLQKLGHRVLGVDWSYTMCRASEKHPERSPAVVGDAADLPLADRSADCAIAFMSLQDIDDMQRTVEEISRILEDDCPLILAIVHPMYSGGRFFSLGESTDNYFVLKRSYLKQERLVSTDGDGSLTVTFFREHRPLQAYTQALLKAGFNIEQLIELTDDDEARDRDGIPVFLDIVARRRPREKPADSMRIDSSNHSTAQTLSRLPYRNHRRYQTRPGRAQITRAPLNSLPLHTDPPAAAVIRFASRSWPYLSGLIVIAAAAAAFLVNSPLR